MRPNRVHAAFAKVDVAVVRREVSNLRDARHDHGFGVEVQVVVHHVGGNQTLEAPFTADNLLNHAHMVGSVRRANTVEGNHDAHAERIAQRALEAAQVGFTELLLGHVRGDAGAVVFLIVEAHVLRAVDNALVGAALNHFTADDVGQHRVFGDVLVVASVIGRAVQRQTAAPQVVAFNPQAGVALNQAPLIRQFRVEGAAQQRLGVDIELVGLASRLVGVASADAGRAFVLDDDGVVDVGQGIGAAAAVDNCADRFVDGDSMNQLVPVGVIDVVQLFRADFGCREFRAGDSFRRRARVGDGVGFAAHFGNPLILLRAVSNLEVQLVVVNREGVPVLAGQVSDRAGQPVVQVGVVRHVGNGRVVRNGKGGVVQLIELPAHDSLAARRVHAVSNGFALRRQNVVDRLMRAGCCREVVVARIEDVGFGVVRVVACQILGGNSNGNFLALAGGDVHLGRVQEHDRGLFNQIRAVIVGVGLLHIQLGEEFAVLIGVVLHFDDGGDVAVHAAVNRHALDGLGVIKIAQAVTKGVEHFVGVIPRAALRCAGCAVGVALTHDGVKVTGFVVLVADVDTFRLDDVHAAVVGIRTAEGARADIADFLAGITRVVITADDFVIREVVAADVLHRRDGLVVAHESACQRARRVDLAGQHVRDADGLVVVRAADVADAVHLVRAALGDVGNHHVVAGVQQHDDLGAGFLRRLDNRQLIGRKLQRIFAGCFTRVVERRARLVGIALAGAARKHADADGVLGNCALPVGGHAQRFKFRRRNFRNLVRRPVARRADVHVVIHRGGNFLARPAVGAHLGVHVDDVGHVVVLQRLVDVEACTCQRIRQRRRVRVAALGAIDVVRRQTEQGNVRVRFQRKNAVVVLHDDRTFFAFTDGDVARRHVFDGRVVGLEARRAVVIDGHIAFRTQGIVQCAAVGVCHTRADDGENHQAGHECRKASHCRGKFLRLHVFPSFHQGLRLILV